MKGTTLLAPALVVALSVAPGCDRSSDSDGGQPSSPAAGWKVEPHDAGPFTPPVETTKWTAVDAALDAWTPMLEDDAGDTTDKKPGHDLRRVMLVLTDEDVLVRFELAEPPAPSDTTDMRFWLEQGERFLTVETKRASANQECTLSEVGKEVQSSVEECYHVDGGVVDIAIPRKEIPSSIDMAADFWVSGPQVCCSDAERTQPLDRLDASQVVWRSPTQP